MGLGSLASMGKMVKLHGVLDRGGRSLSFLKLSSRSAYGAVRKKLTPLDRESVRGKVWAFGPVDHPLDVHGWWPI